MDSYWMLDRKTFSEWKFGRKTLQKDNSQKKKFQRNGPIY